MCISCNNNICEFTVIYGNLDSTVCVNTLEYIYITKLYNINSLEKYNHDFNFHVIFFI